MGNRCQSTRHTYMNIGFWMTSKRTYTTSSPTMTRAGNPLPQKRSIFPEFWSFKSINFTHPIGCHFFTGLLGSSHLLCGFSEFLDCYHDSGKWCKLTIDSLREYVSNSWTPPPCHEFHGFIGPQIKTLDWDHQLRRLDHLELCSLAEDLTILGWWMGIDSDDEDWSWWWWSSLIIIITIITIIIIIIMFFYHGARDDHYN